MLSNKPPTNSNCQHITAEESLLRHDPDHRAEGRMANMRWRRRHSRVGMVLTGQKGGIDTGLPLSSKSRRKFLELAPSCLGLKTPHFLVTSLRRLRDESVVSPPHAGDPQKV
jgi:hypothetical protein